MRDRSGEISQTMDIQRDESHKILRRRKQILLTAAAVLGVVLLFVWTSTWKASAYPVERETVWTGQVKRGEMLRQVRGPGTLEAEEIQWIAAETDGQVLNKLILPGSTVTPDSVILELSNPSLEQQALESELGMRAAEAEAQDLAVRLQSELLSQQAEAARAQSEWEVAKLDLEAQSELSKEGLTPEIVFKRAQLTERQTAERAQIEKDRLAKQRESAEAQLASQRSRLQQLKSMAELRSSQMSRLKVRAGIAGVLQEVPLEVGQRVQPGANLALVANPSRLKAVLQIPQVQAKDLVQGQKADIDTRNGIVAGRVMRIDPAVREGSVTVDVELLGELPRGARPDLSVEGTIEIERLENVLYVGRPTSGQANSQIKLFKIGADGEAIRVPVELGRASVNTIEVIQGLNENDEVILSDTSSYDEHDVIQLK